MIHGAVEVGDPAFFVVASRDDLLGLRDDVLAVREQPVIGVTLRAYEREPVLDLAAIRSVVGPAIRVYLISDDALLEDSRELLGARLRLDRGTIRIWCPVADTRGDAVEHPVVVALEGEDRADALEEFGYRFDLARPRVRGRISLLEDAQAFLEHELSRAHEQTRRAHERLRDAQIECHALRTRAEAAEASLAASRRLAG